MSETPRPRVSGRPSPAEKEAARPLIPDRTRDEEDEGWGDRDHRDDPDERLRREVPPHHG